jgi:SAM-dependent methyltransferase
MLEELRAKAGDTHVSIVIGEGAQLPLPSRRFHAVVIARLLYLPTDWSRILNEARRVLAGGGCLLHEWGNGQVGEEWVRVREEARSLFEHAGVLSPFHPGARSESAIEEALDGLRLVRETDVVLGPGPSITLREFLRRLTEGELSYIWRAPENVRRECLPRLVDWAERTFDLDRSIPTPRDIRWTVYRKQAA